MSANYEKIRKENREKYGTDIARIGPMLLADRYDDRTHFIFELLQNAEDALARRGDWDGPRKVQFLLTSDTLLVSHYGRPFNTADVSGVCGIAESTKDPEDSIGRFGIGFKSVFTFTDRPSIHSGDEDFSVQNYVEPIRDAVRDRRPDETLIVLPLRSNDTSAHAELVAGFRNIGSDSLLFLRNIDQIEWSVQDGPAGFYFRDDRTPIDDTVSKVKVVGQETGQPEVDQEWLVFKRDVASPSGRKIWNVEVAFALRPDADQQGRVTIHPVAKSPLVVFFPTVLETHLGFLAQGPYRTTPSRDNVPRNDLWNQQLVRETATLLIDSLKWLRNRSVLDTSALRCLPLDPEKFSQSMFAPVFLAVRSAMLEEPLLPRFDGGYITAGRAKLARTLEIRELFSPDQLSTIMDAPGAAWLTGDITEDRAPELRQYLRNELGVAEVTPALLVPKLNKAFLEAQTDKWICRLYEFLNGQEAAVRRVLDTVPLIRLRDGTHIVARTNGKVTAFFPTADRTGFPTIRSEVCESKTARDFLVSLGITEPDPVDDVVWNVLPKYRKEEVSVGAEEYASDIGRILRAFETDSKGQRDKLLAELRRSDFVMVVDLGDGQDYVAKPQDTYISTERLKQLFQGVEGVLIVDDSYECLTGESVRALLEACGAVRYLRPVSIGSSFSYEELRQLRKAGGHEETSNRNDEILDWTLLGLDDLIALLPSLPVEERKNRARLVWEALADLEERRGRGVFDGLYSWTHHGSYKKDFSARFIRDLNDLCWVSDADGELQTPGNVIFEDLNWKPNPFLASKITFRSPIVVQLAKEVGIDPATIDLLKKLGITSVAELTSRLGLDDSPAQPTELNDTTDGKERTKSSTDDKPNASDHRAAGAEQEKHPMGGDDAVEGQHNAIAADSRNGHLTGPRSNQSGGISNGSGADRNGNGMSGDASAGRGSMQVGSKDKKPSNGNSSSSRQFISYIGTHATNDAEENDDDPDGLDKLVRMQIEESAICHILNREPHLCRTPAGNHGFDLCEKDDAGNSVRWIEVKSMTGSLAEHPVCLSRKQFDFARQYGAAYWLYVVEHATNSAKIRVLRIQNPFGNARYFTFDSGWAAIAEVEGPGGLTEPCPTVHEASDEEVAF
jgi:hypothetical protein